MEPGIRPRALETVAVTGGRPVASRTGKVMSVPEPTIVLIAPALIPAAKTASISQMDMAYPPCVIGACCTNHARGVYTSVDRGFLAPFLAGVEAGCAAAEVAEGAAE